MILNQLERWGNSSNIGFKKCGALIPEPTCRDVATGIHTPPLFLQPVKAKQKDGKIREDTGFWIHILLLIF